MIYAASKRQSSLSSSDQSCYDGHHTSPTARSCPMSQKPLDTPHPRLYLLATAVGFVGLILWFYAGRELGILQWIVDHFPASHAGAGLMVAIMILMTPGFLLWKLFNRWIEAKLKVKGRFLEDEVYLPPDQDKKNRS